MGDYQPHYFPADNIPLVLTGTVTGGQPVNAGGTVCTAGDGAFVGIADRDGVAGDQIEPYTEGMHTVIASGAVAVGDRIKTAAGGKFSKFTAGTDASDLQVGKALTAAADGNTFDLLLA